MVRVATLCVLVRFVCEVDVDNLVCRPPEFIVVGSGDAALQRLLLLVGQTQGAAHMHCRSRYEKMFFLSLFLFLFISLF